MSIAGIPPSPPLVPTEAPLPTSWADRTWQIMTQSFSAISDLFITSRPPLSNTADEQEMHQAAIDLEANQPGISREEFKTAVLEWTPLHRNLLPSPPSPATLPLPSALEKDLDFLYTKEIDVDASQPFTLYLTPNEGKVRRNAPNLRMDTPGLLVSTGTHRSFFNLIMCVEKSGELCQGLVIQDINPVTKAYCDFEILLLRIADDHQEFKELCAPLKDFEQDLQERIEQIREKISRDPRLSPLMKIYYYHHLNDFAKLYYKQDQEFRRENPGNKGNFTWGLIRYWDSEPQAFSILQEYAQMGRIVASTGDIGQLEFLENRPVNILDISNIHYYSLIDIDPAHIPQRLIFTEPGYSGTWYTTAENLTPITPDDRKIFDKLFEERFEFNVEQINNFLIDHLGTQVPPAGYFQEIFSLLQLILAFDTTGTQLKPLNFSDKGNSIQQLSNCDEVTREVIFRKPEFHRLLPHFRRFRVKYPAHVLDTLTRCHPTWKS